MTIMTAKNYDNMNENVTSKLPPLDDEDTTRARSHQNLSWAHGFMNNHREGQTIFINSGGINLQKVSDQAVRCVAVVDHPYCYTVLSMAVITFERAGIELQIDPYTVVIPFVPREKDKADTSSGVEVV